MTKTLTEQWCEGTLPENTYYVQFICGRYGIYEFEQFKGFGFDNDLAYIKEVLAPVPSYDEYLYLKTNNDHWNKEAIRISKQAIGIVLESDELVQKIHILNEQNTKQYNELCEEIKKNNILEKKLEIATKALKKLTRDCNKWEIARKALKEMKGDYIILYPR